MSTTYIQALPNVRGRMSYTEHGEGSRRREHLRNGTDRIAAQMGDMPSREEFVEYCESLHGVHPAALNEGYELRVSWATDELKPENPDDVQRGLEHAYTLCHRLAPDSPCWVTMHVDGEGGCVHAHATIANHDCRTGQVVNKGDTSLYAPRVQAVNDVLSRESGLSVLGADKVRSTWAERRDEFASDSFDRRLGDAVQLARNLSDDVDSFKSYLKAYDIELKETTKTDKRTGEVTTGWSYRMRDVSRSFFADSSIHALRFLSLLLRLLSFDFSLCILLAQAGQYFDIPELGTYSTPHTVQFLGFNAVHRFVGVICNSPTKPMNL